MSLGASRSLKHKHDEEEEEQQMRDAEAQLAAMEAMNDEPGPPPVRWMV